MNSQNIGFTVGIFALIIIGGQWFLISQIKSDQTSPQIFSVENTTQPQIELNELVNETYGYKFKYPSNWSAISIQETVEVSTNNINAKILVKTSDTGTNFQIEGGEELSTEKKREIEKVLETIQETFETMEKKEVTEQEISERYMQTLNGDN